MDLLSLLVFAPVPAILLILITPNNKNILYRNIAMVSTIAQFVLSIIILIKFDASESRIQLSEKLDWITVNMQSMGYLSIDYFVGVDGLNMSLIVLSTFIFVVGLIASWTIKENAKAYYSLYLLLTISVLGCFVALDLFLFFLFFEFMLLPMYFLIGMWGGTRREYAAIKFFLYTLAGSIFILIAIVALSISAIEPYETANQMNINGDNASVLATIQSQLQSDKIPNRALVHTLNILQLSDKSNYIKESWLAWDKLNTINGIQPRSFIFLLLLVGFLIKVPSFPVHTWLPDAHVEASTPISVILAALLLKTGAYGILRVAFTIMPDQAKEFAWLVATLGVISIIYAAYNALAMNDLKKMVAYSSISHMGFVLLGIAAATTESISGAVFQMVSHGVISAALFLIVGVLYDRTHNRNIDTYRGLASKMPVFTTITVITFFASLGLPGFSGFIGEVLILLGAFASHTHNGLISRWFAVVATFGILLSAAYYLWTLQRVFFGKYWVKNGPLWSKKLFDLSYREKIMLFPLVMFMIVLGLFPNLILDIISPTSALLSEFINNR